MTIWTIEGRVTDKQPKPLTIPQALEFIFGQLDGLKRQQTALTESVRQLMATSKEVKDAVDGLDAKIDALIAKVGEGGIPADVQADLDATFAKAMDESAKLDAAVNPTV